MSKQNAKLAVILFFSVVFFACETEKKPEPKKRIHVEVKAVLEGKPAAQAKVFVDGDEVGVTDDMGYLAVVVEKKPGLNVQVSAVKEAPGYKIEPWKTVFIVKTPEEAKLDKDLLKMEKYSFDVTFKAIKYIFIAVGEDGKAVKGATIKVMGKKVADTDETGKFTYEYSVQPKNGLKIEVTKKGYTTWRKTVKIAPGKIINTAIKAQKITIVVTENGKAVKGAVIKIKGIKVADTGKTGKFIYEYDVQPKGGLKIEVTKKEYTTWRKTVKIKPGQIIKTAIYKQAVFTFKAFTEEYDLTKWIAGVVVSLDGKKLGETDSKGFFEYVHDDKPGKKVSFTLSAPGYTHAKWKTEAVLDGKHTVKRFFYPATPKPVRIGIYGYVNNTPDEDLQDVLMRIEEAVDSSLFDYKIFRKVPKHILKEKMEQAKVDIEKMTTDGWQETPLVRTVDIIILGSVAKNKGKMTIETRTFASDGKLVLSHINRASGRKYIKKTARKIAQHITDQFPFEGLIVAEDNERYKINLGSLGYELQIGMELAVMSPTLNEYGRVMKYDDIGTLRIKRTEKKQSWVGINKIKEGRKVGVGYKVRRLMYRERENKSADSFFTILVKGGLPPDIEPLGGVNVYIDDSWAGTTGSGGEADIPVHVGKTYDLVLYRHGYERLSQRVRTQQDKEFRDYVLNVNNSLFKVESRPSNAKVFIDDKEVGVTPILKGVQVGFGFRKLRLTVSGDYRDWENVVDFNRKIVTLTGKDKIVFYKDYLKVGKRAEREGEVDLAIFTYGKAKKGHPDYSKARYRLAQIYMDEKNDYASAAREFENVLSLPENEQLIYKQYAVTYTNLGHAYCEIGNSLVRKDNKAAARNFAYAIKNLQTAKQNTRFFPSRQYDEALHDTHYYLALAYHKLYLIMKKDVLLDKADLAWQEYFDFFPQKLQGNRLFAQIRDSAEEYWLQIKDMK
jgi:tetratricopeptide (TPR) repeat protein